MLSRLASGGSYGWLFAGGLAAGIAVGVAVQLTKPTPPPAPTYMCIEQLPTTLPTTCSAENELIRATAVIHYFDDEVALATAADPMDAKAKALLALPMMCTNSEYSYPALSKHFESAAVVALERGDKWTAAQLVRTGRAYRVDPRMLDTIESSIAK